MGSWWAMRAECESGSATATAACGSVDAPGALASRRPRTSRSHRIAMGRPDRVLAGDDGGDATWDRLGDCLIVTTERARSMQRSGFAAFAALACLLGLGSPTLGQAPRPLDLAQVTPRPPAGPPAPRPTAAPPA